MVVVSARRRSFANLPDRVGSRKLKPGLVTLSPIDFCSVLPPKNPLLTIPKARQWSRAPPDPMGCLGIGREKSDHNIPLAPGSLPESKTANSYNSSATKHLNTDSRVLSDDTTCENGHQAHHRCTSPIPGAQLTPASGGRWGKLRKGERGGEARGASLTVF